MKKICFICLALQFLGFGITVVLKIGLGCDAITMMNDVIAQFLHVNYTISGFLYSTILLLSAFVFARDLIGVGSIAYSYLCGITIDFYGYLLQGITLSQQDIIVKLIFLFVGQLCISFGFAMLIQLHLGRSPLDAILAKLEDVFHISYRTLKTICDILYVIIAFFLGSTFGIGTVLCVLCSGYTIQKFCILLFHLQKKQQFIYES